MASGLRLPAMWRQIIDAAVQWDGQPCQHNIDHHVEFEDHNDNVRHRLVGPEVQQFVDPRSGFVGRQVSASSRTDCSSSPSSLAECSKVITARHADCRERTLRTASSMFQWHSV